MSSRLTAFFLTGAILAACTGPEPEPQSNPAEEGAALLAPFKANLKNELVTSMEAGVDEAIAACNTAAPAIAESLSVEGVRMGRSSHKLRNPANVAPDWAAPAIESYVVGETQPVTVELDDGRHGYIEPIMMQPLCLTCHGQELQPEVQIKLAQLYPDDQATGFAAGDFRGVFWVEFGGN